MTHCIIDIETNGLNRFESKIVLFGAYIPEYDFEFIGTKRQEIIDFLMTLPPDTIFVYQNGKFDTLFVEEAIGVELPLDEDVMILSYVLDMGASKGLDDLVMRHFGEPSWDIPLKEKMKDTPKSREYLGKDLRWTWKLFDKLHARLDERTSRLYYDLAMPSFRAYRVVERNGIQLDMERLESTIKEFEKEATRLENELKQVANINWNSTSQIGNVLFKQLYYPILEKTPKGMPSTSAEVLQKLSKMGYELCDKILEYKYYTKGLGTFLYRWKKDQVKGRLYPTFNIDTTITGRTSCKNPNLQQVPRDKRLRSLFTAKPGYVLLEADQSQVELRIAAHVANEKNMLQAYLDGSDLHTKTAIQVSGKEKPSKEDRNRAKPINFGFLYGMIAKSFPPYAEANYGVKFTDEEAKQIRDTFFNSYPTLIPWYEKQKQDCQNYGGIYTMFGRFRAIPDIYSDKWWISESGKRQAINTPVQSAASDILLGGLIDIVASNIPVFPVGTVHDSILIEVPEKEADSLRVKIVKMMENPSILKKFGITLNVPLKADAEFGNWGSK